MMLRLITLWSVIGSRSWLAVELRSLTTQQSAVALVGKIGRFALGFIASVIVARSLGPSAYGLIAMISLVLLVADTIGDFGLTYATVHAVSRYLGSEPDRARWLIHGYFSLAFVANTVAAIVGIAFAEPIARLMLARPEAEPYVRLALLGLVSMAGSGFATALLQSTGRFGELAAIEVLTAFTYVSGIVLLTAFDHLSIASLVILGAINPLIGLFVGFRLLPRGLVSASKTFTKPARLAWGKLLGFGKWLWASTLLSLLASQLDLLILSHLAPAPVVGVYALAYNLAMKMDIVNQARLTVLLPSVSTLQTRKEMSEHVRRTLVSSVLLGIGFILLMPLFPPLVVAFYGHLYADAVNPLMILTVVIVIDLIASPIILLAFPLDQSRALAAADGARVVTLLLAAWLLIPMFGPVGAALARLLSRMVGVAFTLVLIAEPLRKLNRARSVGATFGDGSMQWHSETISYRLHATENLIGRGDDECHIPS